MYDKCSDCEYTNYDNYVQKIETQQMEEQGKCYENRIYDMKK